MAKKKYPVRNKIKCMVINVPQLVKVRKNFVDTEKLKKVLKIHKNMSNNEIALKLNINKTTVDHWFRLDNGFSIPNEDIWYQLKWLLNIETNEFDKGITEYEYKLGTYEKSERCYSINGISPTITSSDNVKIIL